jgi:hypothetical protein
MKNLFVTVQHIDGVVNIETTRPKEVWL